MRPFSRITAVAVPFDQPNVDTDQIIPARFLGRVREEQREGLFRDLRYDEQGRPRAGFVLNDPAYAGAEILVANTNFGCGSSRENAVTALLDNGFRVFIAPSFGDIFNNNCYQNGCLPIVLSAARCAEIREHLARSPGARMTIDLEAQTVSGPDNQISHFEIDGFRKEALLKGLDEVAFTLSHARDIAAFEARRQSDEPWA